MMGKIRGFFRHHFKAPFKSLYKLLTNSDVKKLFRHLNDHENNNIRAIQKLLFKLVSRNHDNDNTNEQYVVHDNISSFECTVVLYYLIRWASKRKNIKINANDVRCAVKALGDGQDSEATNSNLWKQCAKALGKPLAITGVINAIYDKSLGSDESSIDLSTNGIINKKTQKFKRRLENMKEEVFNDADPSEKINSIIREKTSEEDKHKIRRALNDSVQRGTGIIGGGQFYFRPYTFHHDEPREVYVCTIPYLLSERCPILLKLADILQLTVDIIEDYDANYNSFIDKLRSFNRMFGLSAGCIDILKTVQTYLEEKAPLKSKEKVKQKMEGLITRLTETKKDFYTDDSDTEKNVTSIMGMLFKLLDGIIAGKHLTNDSSPRYHDTFLMAYDKGADNRNFFGKLFGKPRPSVNTCLSWTTVGGLDQSTAYHEDRFLKAYERLGRKTSKEIERFFKIIEKNL